MNLIGLQVTRRCKKIIDQIQKWGKFELAISATFYLLGVGLGGLYAIFAFQNPQEFVKIITPIFEDIMREETSFKFGALFKAILQRNLAAAAITAGLGLFHRILPLLILLFNGLVLGMVFYATLAFFSGGLFRFISLVLPHGVFEIPALLIAGALGVHLTYQGKGKGFNGRLQALKDSKLILLFIILLLVIAALIETTLVVRYSK